MTTTASRPAAKRVVWTVTVTDAAGQVHSREIVARPYARNVKRFALSTMRANGVDLEGATVTATHA